jgi:hypothetical protein
MLIGQMLYSLNPNITQSQGLYYLDFVKARRAVYFIYMFGYHMCFISRVLLVVANKIKIL